MSTIAKEAAGKKAAGLVEDGMIVGLGTGSTTRFFISELGKRCRSGLRIEAVATSLASQQQAEEEGIPLIVIDGIDTIDLDVDGADEIDPLKRMIKGGGGALFREKIIAGMSKEMIVIVDESKVVEYFGKFPLPVEVSSFGHLATLRHLKEKNIIGTLRQTPHHMPFITDNNNLIVDIQLPYPCLNPEEIDDQIRSITGVIETGFFFGLAGRVVIGQNNGKVKIDEKSILK